MPPISRPRARRGSLDRERIVDAAERIVERRGYESLSMRSLASTLDVAPMSLYGHVRDKDDLLDEIVDRQLASRWEPRIRRDDWHIWVRDAAERLRDLLIAEPAALHVYLSHPVVSPNAVARMDAMLEVLRKAGLSVADAEHAYAALYTYTVGFAALEASRAKNADAPGDDHSLRTRLARFTTGAQFREGLTYLLAGIESVQVAAE